MNNNPFHPFPDPAVFSLLTDKDFYLRKAMLAKEINNLYALCTDELQKTIDKYTSHLPEEINSVQAKISRGENYLGFPWTLLDYPRYFTKQHIFALRTLCWWGNHFSITFHLSGNFAARYAEHFFSRLEELTNEAFFICVNENQWDHHFEPGNYKPVDECLSDLSFYKEECSKKEFIKISRLVPFTEWERFPAILTETAEKYFTLIKE